MSSGARDGGGRTWGTVANEKRRCHPRRTDESSFQRCVHMQVLGSRCFETTDTCNSDHMGTTGQGQLYACHLWNVGNASPRKDSNPHTLRFPTHPLKHTRSVILSQDVCTRPCFLDTDDTSPCQTYIMNYSRTWVLTSVLEENNICLRFPSPLDLVLKRQKNG